MGYYCDLEMISLQVFKSNIMSQQLLPSQKILLNEIDKNFDLLEEYGINNLSDLCNRLKTKNKAIEFSKESGILEKYIIVLRREAFSYHPAARKLADYKLIGEETKNKLISMKIKTTAQLFKYVETKDARKKFTYDTGFSIKETILLAKLCDVSRLRYVNAAFAELLIQSSYDSVKKIKNANNIKLYEELTKINKNKRYYKGHIGVKDMDFLIRDKANAEIVLDI